MATTPEEYGISPAEHAAMEWLLRLQEQPEAAAVHDQFDAWLAAAPGNAVAWAEIGGLYARLGDLAPLPSRAALASTGEIIPLPPDSRRRPPRHGMAMLAAACLALVFVAGILANFLPRFTADYSTGIAGRREVALEDGSQIYLGPDSAVDVAFDVAGRHVRLLRGAAYFEVAADPARPFVVSAAGIEVTALGTAFDVDFAADGVRVALAHGRVRVVQGDFQAELLPGDWRQLAFAGTDAAGEIAPDQIAAWRSGHLVARDRTIADVAAELDRSYRGIILVPDAALAARRVTGVYSLDDPAAALAAIAHTHNAHLSEITPWVMLLRPDE